MYKRKTVVDGLCYYCQKQKPLESKSFCSSCQQRWLDYQAKKRSRNKTSGTCLYCSNTAIPSKRWCAVCETKRKTKSQLNRDIVYDHYGRICRCCGESEIAFLTIDHTNNDGCNQRRQHKCRDIYRWIIKNNFPPDLQVLCYNCNCGKARNGGICPHQEKKTAIRSSAR